MITPDSLLLHHHRRPFVNQSHESNYRLRCDALSAIVLGGKGWVGCDSVVTTNCVQSFQDASGTDITKARVVNYNMEGMASIHLVHVYGVSDGITYSNEIVANLNRELAGQADYDFSTSDTFVIKILLESFAPKGMMSYGGNIQSWSYDYYDTLFTITVKPSSMSRTLTGTCNSVSCANQSEVDFNSYVAIGVTDMSDMPLDELPANMQGIVAKMNGFFISTNAQHVTMPKPGSGKFTFSLGSPHLKEDGTVYSGGFFKVFMPDQLLEYMWEKSPAMFEKFTSTVGGDDSKITFTETTNGGYNGVLMEQTDITFSVKDVEISPEETDSPSVSQIGLGILAGLFALLLVWTIQRRRRTHEPLAA